VSQIDLFGEPPPTEDVQAAPCATGLAAVADALPARLRLGTSSWSFPGWAGIVYAQHYPAARLSQQGLAAYVRHPLLRTVGLDSTFYNPLPATKLRAWAEQVPGDFRFLVKGARQVTSPWRCDSHGRPAGPNPDFLSSEFATAQVIEPLLEGMADKLGILLWQFPPLGRQIIKHPRRFAEDLYRFLKRLPAGPSYSIELRDPELATPDFLQALHHGGAVPAIALHPRLPALADQQAGINTPPPGPLVIRWMLRRDRRYEEAKADFSPFDRLQAEDPESRSQIVQACRGAIAAGRDVYVIANNKAEGSSPLSLAQLARELIAT
jgi:uncharacterized protein YecE (DUF72 family)